jgi:hypothetical protein
MRIGSQQVGAARVGDQTLNRSYIGAALETGGVRVAFASTRLRQADRTSTLASTFFSALMAIPAKSPNRMLKNPRVFIPGFYSNNTGASPTELICPNQFGVAYALEIAGTRYRATFSGSGWTTRGGAGSLYGQATPFDVGILSDPIKNGSADLIIPANSLLRHLSIVRIANAGEVYPASQSITLLTGGVVRSSTDPTGAALESLLTTGTITASGSAPPLSFAPAYMVAEDADTGALVSFLLTGDSRFYGVGDFGTGTPASEPENALQAGQRALADLGIPHGNICIPGSTPVSDCVHRYASINAVRDTYGVLPFNYSLSNHGNNGSQSTADNVAELTALKAAFPGSIKWGKATMPPRIGTGGDYRTVAGQTPAAADVYPSGQRALLNAFQLANTSGGSPIWDFVIDMGKYGSAAKDLAYTDPDFNDRRSKFPVGPSSAVASAWTNVPTITMNSGAFNEGDLIAVGSSFVRANIIGPLSSKTDNGNGTFTYGIQAGGYPSAVTYNVGDPATRVASKDGTHEGPWVSDLEALAIKEWYQAGMPTLYPVA